MTWRRKLTTVLPWSVLSWTMPATRGSFFREGAASAEARYSRASGRRGCAVAGRQRFPVLAGDAVKVAGALAEYGVAALYACQLGYVL